jgi:hypothetical protein
MTIQTSPPQRAPDARSTAAERMAARLAGPPREQPPVASLTVDELLACVMSSQARCASSGVDPDEWFPITAAADGARVEASRALALCATCPVRGECLELSLRQWAGVGRHGIWGGLVEAERSLLRVKWLAGVPVAALLQSARLGPEYPRPDRRARAGHRKGTVRRGPTRVRAPAAGRCPLGTAG